MQRARLIGYVAIGIVRFSFIISLSFFAIIHVDHRYWIETLCAIRDAKHICSSEANNKMKM